jgi:tetratricopeptide (TPR) repeat protein
VLALQPDDAQACVNLGLILQLQGRLEAAMPRYARAFALQPDTFGRIANALCSEPHGRLWLDLEALKRALAALSPAPAA